MISPHLLAERERLLTAIQQTRAAGEVAPAYCWLTTTSSTKRGRVYMYMVLVLQEPGTRPKSQSLGRPGSARHRHWQVAIARREAIAELEQQLAMLEGLIQRQTSQAAIVQQAE